MDIIGAKPWIERVLSFSRAVLVGLSLAWVASPASASVGFVLVPVAQEVRQFELATGKLLQKLNLPLANVYRNAVRTGDGKLLVAGNDSVSIVDEADPSKIDTIPLLSPAVVSIPVQETAVPVLEQPVTAARRLFGLDYEPRTGLAYLGVHSTDGETVIYSLDPKRRKLEILSTFKDIAAPKDLVVTADGLRVYISSVELLPEPAARVWPINPLTGIRGDALSAAFDPTRPQLSLSVDGNLLYLVAADESLIVVNTRSNNPVRRLRLRSGPGVDKLPRILRVLGASDNRHLWVLQHGHLLLWDAYTAQTDLDQQVDTSVLDLAMSADKSRLWSLVSGQTGKPPELQQSDGLSENLTLISRSRSPAGANRIFLSESPTGREGETALPRVAVVGFETGPVRYGRFPNVADIVSGSLLRTRRYEIVSPVQVRSALDALGLGSAQLQSDPDLIRQVASLLGADIVLVGDPLKVEMPNRTLEALSGIISAPLAFLLPQLSSPKVFASAQAFDQNGASVWKANVANFDPAFFAGKADTTLLSNAMVITGQDIANRFSKGAYNEVKDRAAGSDPPPLARDETLKKIHTVALLGPDSALFNEQTNSAESFGQSLAPQLSETLGWEVNGPNDAFSRLGELGIEREQVLTTDPKLLARALGVDAVMLGLVRSSTYLSGGILGFNQGGTAEIVLQFQLVDQQGRVLWKDIQVRTIDIGTGDAGPALRQAGRAIVERLKLGIKGLEAEAAKPGS